jgi:hypothetical protein
MRRSGGGRKVKEERVLGMIVEENYERKMGMMRSEGGRFEEEERVRRGC